MKRFAGVPLNLCERYNFGIVAFLLAGVQIAHLGEPGQK